MQVKDNTFLITGGARGLGAQCARRLKDEGANVVIADLDAESGTTLQSDLAMVCGSCARM